MAAGGGGSWKVAYADFVTAMMAFFLVMWIGSQDQKTRQSVANYFIDPSGSAKKPAKTGAVFDSLSYGSVAKEESVAVGRGRDSHTSRGENSPSTKLVSDWIHSEKKTRDYWRKQAQQQFELAARSQEVRDRVRSADAIAVVQLSKQLREEITRDIPTQASGLYQDLLFGSVADVNWTQIAEDLLLN